MVAILSRDVGSPKHRRVGNGDASEVSTSVSGCTLFGQNHEAISSTEIAQVYCYPDYSVSGAIQFRCDPKLHLVNFDVFEHGSRYTLPNLISSE
ncbi:uncharacterized protein RSE6_08855 [Rhynchosporium secalis]|uniref:Uncharacterized protein n=1 Tax=Rhynchosporium secalis TaxID=38038 RepID=A0A1E1MGH5_RHYSE|nr:uncharacterized protein RSE6_08855 [Rhynchosporium secalis]